MLNILNELDLVQITDSGEINKVSFEQDENGDFLVGDDGLWVDPYTLQQGDRFIQQHLLQAPDRQGAAGAAFALEAAAGEPGSGEVGHGRGSWYSARDAHG